MSDTEEKTDVEKTRDIISQLKEMHHYSKTNIEKLSDFWLLMEGELKQKENGKRMEDLITKQTVLHEEVEALYSDMEIECNRIDNEAS